MEQKNDSLIVKFSEFEACLSAIAAIHWDGILMDSLTNESKSEDRLPILLSGVGGVKSLGVPALQHKT